MAFLSIDNFRSSVKGFARATLFDVQVYFDNFDTYNFSFTCKSASIPSSTFGKIEVPYMGRKIQYIGDRNYTDWNTTIIVDNDWTSYRNIYDWHKRMNDARSNKAQISGSYDMRSFKGTGIITAYDQAGNQKLRVKLDGFFPYDMQELKMGWDQNDATADLQVVWAYDFSEVIK
jgi:hypothetical protein